jgi:hypothetical protein
MDAGLFAKNRFPALFIPIITDGKETMKQAYYVTPDRKIESDENGNFKILDLEYSPGGYLWLEAAPNYPLNDAILGKSMVKKLKLLYP